MCKVFVWLFIGGPEPHYTRQMGAHDIGARLKIAKGIGVTALLSWGLIVGKIVPGRRTADLRDRGDVVVFFIGMRINRLRQVWRWLPVFIAMPQMVVELAKDPSRGLLARPRTYVSGRTILLVQYWNSFEDLERYARDPEANHLPAWRAFNRRIRDNGSVGIFHETYRVAAGDIETVYANMPVFGLAGAGRLVPVTPNRQTAASRIGARPNDQAPVDSY